jgi:hypothetical protein
MKKILLLLLPLMASVMVSCEEEKDSFSEQNLIEFRDPNFLKALLVVKEGDLGNPYYDDVVTPYLINVDANMDGKISINEAKAVKALDIDDEDGFEVREMPEIKYFTSLIALHCFSSRLYSIDVSKNKSLKYLDLWFAGGQTTSCRSITLGDNTELEYVGIYHSSIETLDMSGCVNLEWLSLEYNDNLKSLDISKNAALKYVNLVDNQIQKIIVNINNKLPDDFIERYKDIIEYVK